MKQYYALLFFVTIFCRLVSAQEMIPVHGIVKNKLTGEPLIGANIQCGIGTSSDVYGFFSVVVPSVESITIKVSYVGYKNYLIVINPQQNKFVTIGLEPGLDIEEINVHGVRRIEERMDIGILEIPVKQIKTLPMLGEPDVLKAFQLMPGVQGGSDGRNGFYVRGGSPDQNLFMLDGTPLYYINHLGGFVSVFPLGILKNVKLYKGGFPARYGGRLSSLIDLRMKEGNRKEHHGNWGIGLISGDLTLEGPINEKTSYIISTRRMWIDLFTRPAFKIGTKVFSMGYNFYDFFGKISHEANTNNRFYFSLYGGDDQLGYNFNIKDNDSKGYSKYIWGNILGTCRWNHVYSPKLFSDITLFYTRYRYKLNQYGRINNYKNRMIYKTGLQDVGVKADYNWYINNKMIFRFGGGFSGNWFNPGLITYNSKAEDVETRTIFGEQNKVDAVSSYIYIESEFQLFPRLSFNIGNRLSELLVDTENYLLAEPRIMVKYEFRSLGSLKAGYSRMTQAVHMLSYTGNSFPTDIWLPSNKNIKPAVSDQYSFALVRSIKNGMYEFSTEVYYKKMRHLLEVKGGVTLVNTKQWDQNVEKEGTGTSKGLEIMIQKKQGKSNGWISYTLAKTSRRFDNINNGKSYPFSYDRRHDISIVLNHRISKKIDFSATWVYGSGYPITLHNGVHQVISPASYFDDSTEIFIINDEAYLYPGKNWLRMRDFHKLDIGFNFHKKKGNKERIWTLGVYNLYNRQNAVFYYFAHKDQNRNNPLVLYQQSGFPIIPTVKYSVKF